MPTPKVMGDATPLVPEGATMEQPLGSVPSLLSTLSHARSKFASLYIAFGKNLSPYDVSSFSREYCRLLISSVREAIVQVPGEVPRKYAARAAVCAEAGLPNLDIILDVTGRTSYQEKSLEHRP